MSGSRVAVVAEFAALDVAHVAQAHDTRAVDARLEVVAELHEVAAGAELPALGWRHRRHYDMRATFITLAIDDGDDPTCSKPA